MTYWCLTGCSGTLTPAKAPTCRAHCPAQFTTFSQAIVPCVVFTAVMRPSFMSKPMTRTSSNSFAPFMRAPLASDCVMSEGLAWPSVGSHEAPTRSPVSISGHMRLDLVRRDEMHLHAEAFCRGGEPAEFGPAIPVGREPQAARHLPAGGETGLGVEPLVELDRVFQHARDRGRRAQLPDEACRMPGRAGGELALLQEHDVRLMVARQMVGGRAADDAAADDDDLGMSGQAHRAALPYWSR